MLKTISRAAAIFSLMALPTAFASAQAITYLMADNLCVTKHDYQVTKGNAIDFYEFYAYMPQANGKKLIFRIPKFENTFVAKLNNLEPNAKIIDCSNLDALDQDFIDAINAATRTIFVIEKNSDGSFFAYQVDEINTIVETEKGLEYQDKRLKLAYKYDTTYQINANVSLYKNKVAYQSTQKSNCQAVREFKSFSLNNGEPATNITFTEGIGVTKIGYGNSEVELKTVNGMLLSAYANMLWNAKYKKQAEPITTKVTPTAPEKPLGGSTSLFGTTKVVAIDTSKVITNPVIKSTPIAGDGNFTSRGGITPKKGLDTPPKNVPPGYHVVAEKENLYKIAQEYGVSINQIKYWNKLDTDVISINQLLKVVDDSTDPYKSSNPTFRNDNVQHVRYTIHTVEQNDMLGTISKKYNVPIKQLYDLNTLESDFLQIGQELIIAAEYLP
jgi:LysM repeat protein